MAVTSSRTFGDQLRRYRVERGLTQEGLAEQAGLSTRAISDLERGNQAPPGPGPNSTAVGGVEAGRPGAAPPEGPCPPSAPGPGPAQASPRGRRAGGHSQKPAGPPAADDRARAGDRQVRSLLLH